jgi:hypothetical protein
MEGEDEDEEEEEIVRNRKGPIIVTVLWVLKKMVHLLFSEKSQRNKYLRVMQTLQLIVVYI